MWKGRQEDAHSAHSAHSTHPLKRRGKRMRRCRKAGGTWRWRGGEARDTKADKQAGRQAGECSLGPLGTLDSPAKTKRGESEEMEEGGTWRRRGGEAR